MDHRSARDMLAMYIDGQAENLAALESHLVGCTECQREIAELRQVQVFLRRVPTVRVPRSFKVTERALEQRRRERQRWNVLSPIWALRSVMAAAAVLFLFVAGGDMRMAMDGYAPASAQRSLALTNQAIAPARSAAPAEGARPVETEALLDLPAARTPMSAENVRLLEVGLAGAVVISGGALWWLGRRKTL